MNRFTMHIPNFVDHRGEKIPHIDFELIEDLLDHPDFPFHEEDAYYVMDGDYLMKITEDGFHWWVCGRIRYPKLVNLPRWEGWKFRVIMPDGRIELVRGDYVRSVCGDTVELSTGIEVKKYVRSTNHG